MVTDRSESPDEHNEDGSHSVVIQDSGEGRFIFGYAPDLETVRITDIELDQQLIAINAQKIIVPYCVANEDDPGCASVEMEGCGPGYWSSNADPWPATSQP